jgi:chemotaxis signal transduction protein
MTMDSFQNTLIGVHADPIQAPDSWQDRYILTQVGQQQLAFLSSLVTEILVIERSHILTLPFYDPAILGLVHQRGSIIPLINLHSLRTAKGNHVAPFHRRESLTAVRLNSLASTLGDIGIVIDQVLNSISSDQLSIDSSIDLFQPEEIPPSLWQPIRT